MFAWGLGFLELWRFYWILGGFRVLGLCFSVLGAKGMVHRIFFSIGVVFELRPVVSAFFWEIKDLGVFSSRNKTTEQSVVQV